jgi:hypothetical protein
MQTYEPGFPREILAGLSSVLKSKTAELHVADGF